MLIAAFGLPGVMSAWGFAAMRTIAREVLGEHRVVAADRLEAFAAAQGEAGTGDLVLLSQYPETALIEAALNAGAAPILFLENMAGSAAYSAATTDQSPTAIVRAMSASAACLAPLRENPRVLALHRESLGDRRIDVLAAYLCRHLGLTVSERALLTIGRHLGHAHNDDAGPPPGLEAAAERVIKGYVPPGFALSRELEQLTGCLLAPLDALFNFRSMPPIVWPGATFLRGDRPDQPLASEVDLAGGARCLVYGPYFHMPAGRWAARATLAFGADTRDQTFAVEVVAGEVVGRIRVSPEAPGRYAATVTFATSAPLVPVEMRVLMENGAIEGTFLLEDVKFNRIDDLEEAG